MSSAAHNIVVGECTGHEPQRERVSDMSATAYKLERITGATAPHGQGWRNSLHIGGRKYAEAQFEYGQDGSGDYLRINCSGYVRIGDKNYALDGIAAGCLYDEIEHALNGGIEGGAAFGILDGAALRVEDAKKRSAAKPPHILSDVAVQAVRNGGRLTLRPYNQEPLQLDFAGTWAYA